MKVLVTRQHSERNERVLDARTRVVCDSFVRSSNYIPEALSSF